MRVRGKKIVRGEGKKKRKQHFPLRSPANRQSKHVGARDKVGPCNESYTWIPKTTGFVAFQKVGVFSYTGSFSLKGRKWLYGIAPTMGLSFQTLGLFLDSSGLGYEGRYPDRLWVPKRLENAFWADFGSKTVGKCMLDFVCYFPKVEIFGLSPDYWQGMTSFVWTIFGVLLLEIE